MDRTLRFRAAGSRVIHELFDDEVVIVDLETGRYFCTQHAGADVWRLLLAGQTPGDIAVKLTARYDAPEDVIAEGVDRLCASLIAENLIAPAGDADAPTTADVSLDGPPRPFEAPELQVYADMQELLLLDPIHEVDAAGWPMPRPDEPGAAD
jgi:hypothetical protein